MIRTAVFALLATSAFGAPALAETRLEVRHAAARMIVIPEARSDISWTVQGGRAGLPALQMRREGDKRRRRKGPAVNRGGMRCIE